MTEFFIAMIATAVLNYAVFVRLPGLSDARASNPNPIRAAACLGGCVIFITLAACILGGTFNACLFAPLGLEKIAPMILIPAVAGLVWILDQFLKHHAPDFYPEIAPYLPLSGINCASIYAVLSITESNARFADGIQVGFAASVGFAVMNILFAAIENRMNEADLPAPVRGVPVMLLSAGLIAIAMMGLSGLS